MRERLARLFPTIAAMEVEKRLMLPFVVLLAAAVLMGMVVELKALVG